MPDHRITENEPLDTEDWELALEPFKGNPGAALMLGYNFMVLKSYLAVEPLKIKEANEGLDRALPVLFESTQFHEVSFRLFRRLIEWILTLEEEEKLKALGIEF
jgi:hypothetical protein